MSSLKAITKAAQHRGAGIDIGIHGNGLATHEEERPDVIKPVRMIGMVVGQPHGVYMFNLLA